MIVSKTISVIIFSKESEKIIQEENHIIPNGEKKVSCNYEESIKRMEVTSEIKPVGCMYEK